MHETSEIRHTLHSHFNDFRKWRSTKKLLASSFYREIAPRLEPVLNAYEMGHYALPLQEAKGVYRSLAWNLERGMCWDGILKTFKNHPDFLSSDIFFCPETDLGMARSGNRNVAREMAKTLKLNYLFFPAYLNLDKGNGQEIDKVNGENSLGIHGNTLFSRYPIKNPRAIRLKNCKDKMRGKEKRLGSQQAVVADIKFPESAVRVVCIHLDAHSSQRQRYMQMKTILDALDKENWKGSTLIGGDWNTSTYYANHSFFAFWSFWRKVAMGPKHVCETHYPYPERYFEKRLFDFLEERQFDYKDFNLLGAPTMHYHLNDEEKKKNMRDWTPKFFQFFIDWAMRKAEGMARFKIDWFTAHNLQPIAGSQKVIGNLSYKGKPISDHDAIAVEFNLAERGL